MSTDKKEAISIVAQIAPGAPQKFTERIKGDGTIEQLKVRFFTGQQTSLHVRPYVIHHGNKVEDLITYPEGTQTYLSGDDDYLIFDIVCPVKNDDVLVIWVQNTDAEDTYHLNVQVLIDYYGGTMRVT